MGCFVSGVWRRYAPNAVSVRHHDLGHVRLAISREPGCLEVAGYSLPRVECGELAKVLAHYSNTGELLLPDEIGEPGQPSQGDREVRATLEGIAEAVAKLALRADKVDDQLEKLFDGENRLSETIAHHATLIWDMDKRLHALPKEVDARFELNHQRHAISSEQFRDHGNDLVKLFAELKAVRERIAGLDHYHLRVERKLVAANDSLAKLVSDTREELAALRHDLANAEQAKLLANHLAERPADLPPAPAVVISSPLHRAMHSEAKQSTSERLAAAADPQSAEEQAEGELGGGAL